MGVLDIFRRQKNERNVDIAGALAVNSKKDRTEIEHIKQLGIKHDMMRDEQAYNLIDTLCYEYGETEVVGEDGKKHKTVAITGLKLDYTALRLFASQNNSLRFFSEKDARLINLETEGAIRLLELQQPITHSGVNQAVFFNAILQLCKANNIDSINGRKIKSLLINVERTEVGVGEIEKQKGKLNL